MEKIYCGNARVINTQYGEMTKLSLHKDDINKIVKYMKDEKVDWINIVVKEKQNKVDGKPTHYLEVDTYKPTPSATPTPETTVANNATTEDDGSGLPF
jgi:hypothetical protein